MGNLILPIVGSLLVALIVTLLGILLSTVKATRKSVEILDLKLSLEVDVTLQKLLLRVERTDCIREMGAIKDDLKDAIKSIRELERR